MYVFPVHINECSCSHSLPPTPQDTPALSAHISDTVYIWSIINIGPEMSLKHSQQLLLPKKTEQAKVTQVGEK